MNIFRFYTSSIALRNLNHNFYENPIHGDTTLRSRNASSSPTDQTKDHSFYSKSRFFKTEHTTYVKNGLDKRFYKSPHLLRLLRNRNRNRNRNHNRNSLYQSLSQSQSKIKRRNYCNRHLRRKWRRTLRRRKTSAITATRPAASRPWAYSSQSQS